MDKKKMILEALHRLEGKNLYHKWKRIHIRSRQRRAKWLAEVYPTRTLKPAVMVKNEEVPA